MAETIEIYTADDLRIFRDRVNCGEYNLNAVLMKDVDILEIDESGIYVSWTPIGVGSGVFDDSLEPMGVGAGIYNPCYRGTFDGKDHTISGLIINRDSDKTLKKARYISVSGLFGYSSGTIRNLAVKGYVKNCVRDVSNHLGGVCGKNYSKGVIENCINNCVIEGCGDTGGIVGHNNGVLRNCVNNGKIIGHKYYDSFFNHPDDDADGLVGIHMSGIFGYGNTEGKQNVIGCVNTGDIYAKQIQRLEVLKDNNYRYNQIGSNPYIGHDNKQYGKVTFPFQNSVVGMCLSNICDISHQGVSINDLKELLLHDTNTEYKNSLGQTYLHLICIDNYSLNNDALIDFITYLASETNIDFGVRDNLGKTAADYVKSQKIKDLIGSIDQEKKSMAIVDNDNSFSTIGF